MTRTWVLLVGMTLLWASLCLGMEEYAEPTTDDASVGQVAPGVVDPGVADGQGVIEPKPEADVSVTTSNEAGEGEVVGSEPDGGPVTVDEGTKGDAGDVEPRPEVIYYTTADEGGEGEVVTTDAGYDVSTSPDYSSGNETVALDGNTTTDDCAELSRIARLACAEGYEPASLVPEEEVETASSWSDQNFDSLALVPSADKGLMLAQLVQSVTSTVGTPEQANELATSALNSNPNWDAMTELGQRPSTAGENLGTQMSAFTDPFRNLPNIAGEFGTAVSQISAGAQQAFTGFQIPDATNLVGNW